MNHSPQPSTSKASLDATDNGVGDDTTDAINEIVVSVLIVVNFRYHLKPNYTKKCASLKPLFEDFIQGVLITPFFDDRMEVLLDR